MKKRIGTKLYDTDTAICVIPEINLYKQGRKHSYYFYDGETIQPITFPEAHDILEKYGLLDITKRKPEKKGGTALHVSPESADHLAKYCLYRGITQKKVLEDFIATLEL